MNFFRNRPKNSKYGAKSVEIEGIRFASQLEARFYMFFIDHDIKILELQPRFLLEDSFEIYDWQSKKIRKYRKTEYVADFRIETPDGDIFIIEAKGFETPEWKIKKKLFLKKYGSDEKLLVFSSLRQVREFFDL
ncbi:hypothetical protein BLM37_03220 [Candidatus Gracilibacteria bacterium GN02-873]|nr:hypothetical protein BLM37_03220 [Candidatus Gracilibacteria bacterium GN02-873]